MAVLPQRDVRYPVIRECERRKRPRGHTKIVRAYTQRAMPRDARPTVSAVIITRNRKDALSRVLDRLLEQPVGEILVVDNGSSDGTAEHVRGYGDPVRLLEPGENLGLGGRNLAAGEAAGELLLMLDDDCFPLAGLGRGARRGLRRQSSPRRRRRLRSRRRLRRERHPPDRARHLRLVAARGP